MLEDFSYIPFKDFQVLSSKATTHQMAKMAASPALAQRLQSQGGVSPSVASSERFLIFRKRNRPCSCVCLA